MMVKIGPAGTLGIKQIRAKTRAHTGIFFQYLTRRNKAMNQSIIAIHKININRSKKDPTILIASGLTVPVVGGLVTTIENVGTGVLGDVGAEIVAL